jgi:hypothetical protein
MRKVAVALLIRLRRVFVWYAHLIERVAQGPAPRRRALGLLAISLVVAFAMLYLAAGAIWGMFVSWIIVLPFGVTAMLVMDEADPMRRPRALQWFWPGHESWAPLFRRQLWIPAGAGIALAFFVAFAPMTSHGGSNVAANVGGVAFLAFVTGVQAIYLWACSKALRDNAEVPPGLSRNLIASWVAGGVWAVATIGPMLFTVALRAEDQTLVVVGLLITIPGLFALGVMCRGLQAWDEKKNVRHDVAAYAIQGGAIFFLLWLSVCASELVTAFKWAEPDMMNEIFRTLLYGATLLLVPSGWWTLHVINTSIPPAEGI